MATNNDEPNPGGGDWFDTQGPPPQADPFVDQLTALYAQYGRGAPTAEEINAHRGNPGGLAAIEALLQKDNAAANPAPAPSPAPTSGPAPTTPAPASQPQTYGPGGPTSAATTNYGDPLAGVYPDVYVSNTNAPAPPADMAPYVPQAWTGTAPTATPLAQYRPPTQAELEASPGYGARLAAGQLSRNRSAAAQGSVLNGGTQKALERYGQDYASNEYGNLVGQGQATTALNNAATSGDNKNAYDQYVTNYGTFNDSENRNLTARQQNFGEQQTGFQNRYQSFVNANSQSLSDYLTNLTARRNTAGDYWNHLNDLYGVGGSLAGGSYKPGVQL